MAFNDDWRNFDIAIFIWHCRIAQRLAAVVVRAGVNTDVLRQSRKFQKADSTNAAKETPVADMNVIAYFQSAGMDGDHGISIDPNIIGKRNVFDADNSHIFGNTYILPHMLKTKFP